MTKEEFKKTIEKFCEQIANMKFEKPKMYFNYPERKEFNINHFIDWFDCLETYFSTAQIYEEQERGDACHVDRAWQNYATPELKKMLSYLLEEQKQVDKKPYFEAWALIDKEGNVTKHEEERGIGKIWGLELETVLEISKELWGNLDIHPQKGAIIVEFKVTNINFIEGERGCLPPCDLELAPGYEYDIEDVRYDDFENIEQVSDEQN